VTTSAAIGRHAGPAPGLLAGERRAVARAISQIEQGAPGAAALHAALGPHLGRAHVIGITGAPGAGKSTLVHALLGELLARGRRVGVLAVDPSSPISGGAVLGDRVRMGAHGAHPDVFIRSVASRGHPGGLSRTTVGIVDVFDAAGFDTVIVETVGAGQSEVEIMRVADTRIVVCPPGLGDEVQAIKAGILEIADLLAVTKSDLPGAQATARELRDMLHLRAARPGQDWKVAVVCTSASSGDGVAVLLDQALAHAAVAGHGRRLGARPALPTGHGRDAVHARVMGLAAADPFVRALGVTCTDAGPGSATVALTLGPEHLNFNGSCHGGVVFALADTAFGLAANSHGNVAAGIDAHITYQQAAQAGDRLVARAFEVSRSRKLGVYRVDVTRDDGRPISSFTGTVYITRDAHARAAAHGPQDEAAALSTTATAPAKPG
jgi:LAO/AO transport system ATPase/phenylacetic acid degradation protein PaaD